MPVLETLQRANQPTYKLRYYKQKIISVISFILAGIGLIAGIVFIFMENMFLGLIFIVTAVIIFIFGLINWLGSRLSVRHIR